MRSPSLNLNFAIKDYPAKGSHKPRKNEPVLKNIVDYFGNTETNIYIEYVNKKPIYVPTAEPKFAGKPIIYQAHRVGSNNIA